MLYNIFFHPYETDVAEQLRGYTLLYIILSTFGVIPFLGLKAQQAHSPGQRPGDVRG